MAAPNVPQDIIDRLKALERQVRELTGRTNIRPALNTVVGGSITVKDDGTIVLLNAANEEQVVLGHHEPNVSGVPQTGVTMHRTNGSTAFSMVAPGASDQQYVRMFDANGKVIVSDDYNGGLRSPWIPLPTLTNSTFSTWPSVNASAYTTIARTYVYTQHPYLSIRASMGWDSGCTGNVRVLLDGVTVATGSTNAELLVDVAIPGWTWSGTPVESEVVLQLRRVTGSGTSNVYGTVKYIYGRGTP